MNKTNRVLRRVGMAAGVCLLAAIPLSSAFGADSSGSGKVGHTTPEKRGPVVVHDQHSAERFVNADNDPDTVVSDNHDGTWSVRHVERVPAGRAVQVNTPPGVSATK